MAEDYLKEFEYRLAKREIGQETDITLDQLRDQYLEYSKATKTIRSYERHDLPRRASCPAVRRSHLSHNVVKNVAKVKVHTNPPRFLSGEEWDKVKETAQKTDLWPLVATAYYTGFRNYDARQDSDQALR